MRAPARADRRNDTETGKPAGVVARYVPTATNRGVSLYYEEDGEGDPVVFVSDVGYGAWLWAWQAPAIAGPYRTIVWDIRGTGRSDAPPGPYTITGMADDLEAVLSDAGVRSAAVVGAGMGGMIGLQHALSSSRAVRLVLMGTAASGAKMDARAMIGEPDDLSAVLSEAFMADYPEAVEQIVEWRREEDAAPEAAAAHVAAVEGFDVSERLHEITQPALVMHGGEDRVVPVEAGERLAEGLPRGRLERFRDEPHLFFVEQSRLVTDALAAELADGP